MSIRPLNSVYLICLESDEWWGLSPEGRRILEEGLIIAPEKNSHKKRSDKGIVLKIASDSKLSELEGLRTGDRILFRRPSLPLENGEGRLILESQILAKIIND